MSNSVNGSLPSQRTDAILIGLQAIPLLPEIQASVLACFDPSEIAIPAGFSNQMWREWALSLKASGGILKDAATTLESLGVEDVEAARRAHKVALAWLKSKHYPNRRYPEELNIRSEDSLQALTFSQIVQLGEHIQDVGMCSFYDDVAFHDHTHFPRFTEDQSDLSKTERAQIGRQRLSSHYDRLLVACKIGWLNPPFELIPFLPLDPQSAASILEYSWDPIELLGRHPAFHQIPFSRFSELLKEACGKGHLERIQGMKYWPQIKQASLDDLGPVLRGAIDIARQSSNLMCPKAIEELMSWPQTQQLISQGKLSL